MTKTNHFEDLAQAESLVEALRDLVEYRRLHSDCYGLGETAMLQRCLTRAQRLESVLRELAGIEREAA